MNEPVPWIFFCTEFGHPKFLALLPNDLPASYRDFVARVDSKRSMHCAHDMGGCIMKAMKTSIRMIL